MASLTSETPQKSKQFCSLLSGSEDWQALFPRLVPQFLAGTKGNEAFYLTSLWRLMETYQQRCTQLSCLLNYPEETGRERETEMCIQTTSCLFSPVNFVISDFQPIHEIRIWAFITLLQIFLKFNFLLSCAEFKLRRTTYLKQLQFGENYFLLGKIKRHLQQKTHNLSKLPPIFSICIFWPLCNYTWSCMSTITAFCWGGWAAGCNRRGDTFGGWKARGSSIACCCA